MSSTLVFQGARSTRRVAPLATLCLLGALASPVAAQSGLSLSPEFEPVQLSGMAGGPNSAATLGSGPMGACVGWVAAQPNHEMDLTEPFDYLEVSVQSPGDTTLVIEGPVGHWCNDDSQDLNPAMFGRWAEGHYRIWVGTYQQGQNPGYTIRFSDREGEELATATPGAPTPPAPPTYTPPPQTPPGHTPPVHTPPPGYVAPSMTPPAIHTPSAEPGWTIGATPPPGLNATGTTSNFASTALASGFLPDPQSLAGTSGGTIPATGLGNTPTGPCRGWIAQNPDHLVTLNGPFNYLRLDIVSGGDTTLVVQGPAGWWCNDDTIGLNPRVGGSWAPGTYRIWVGSYQGGEYHPYTLNVSEYRP